MNKTEDQADREVQEAIQDHIEHIREPAKPYQFRDGYKHQILVKIPGDYELHHCVYARTDKSKDALLKQAKKEYMEGAQFKCILQPRNLWGFEAEKEQREGMEI